MLTILFYSILGAVTYHETVIVGKRMYLIGGSYNKQTRDVSYKLDLSTMRWESYKVQGANGDPKNVPPSIDEHTACLTSD